jgi:hypothetical protein
MAKKTGYEATPIKEIRRILREDWGINEEEVLAQTKTALVELLLRFNPIPPTLPEDDDIDTVLDAVKEDSDDTAMQAYTEEEIQAIAPAFASDGWQEYVMTQFKDEELDNDAPKCDGCRRVCEVVLGSIISSTLPRSAPPTTSNNGTATVVSRVEVLIHNDSHPLMGQVIVCEEIADVNKDNCDHPYYKHASATAATRAEGRALRKLLRLNGVITAEEASERAETTDSDCDWEVDLPISDSQISVLDMLCKRMDINVMDFINSGRRSYDEIEMVTRSTGQRMIQELNKLQRKTKERPQNVGSYVANWRATQNDGEE